MSIDVLQAIYAVFVWYPTIPATLAFLAIASYYDVKYREIDVKLFIAAVPAIVLVHVIFYALRPFPNVFPLILNAVITGVVTGTTLVLARLGVKGYGDVLLVLVTGLLNPFDVPLWGLHFTPLALTIVYGAAYVVALIVVNVVHNVKRWVDFEKASSALSSSMKLFYLVAGKVMTKDEFKAKKFYFPLYDGSTSRLIAKVGEEPLEGREYNIQGDYVIATYGFPFSLLLLVGYAIFVATLLYLAIVPPASHGCG